MEARRLAELMIKSLPNKSDLLDVKIGNTVLCLVPGDKRPRGQWVEEVVSDLSDEHTVVVGRGRNRKTIAIEDI